MSEDKGDKDSEKTLVLGEDLDIELDLDRVLDKYIESCTFSKVNLWIFFGLIFSSAFKPTKEGVELLLVLFGTSGLVLIGVDIL